MMGRREDDQVQFLYAFDLDKVVPADHLVRQIDGILDLSWVHRELRPYYSHTGRPSIDPVLMIRMLLVGYVFAIRSERRLCSEVQVNLAYRWFCKLSTSEVRKCWNTGSLSSSATFPALATHNLNKLRNPCQRPRRWSIFSIEHNRLLNRRKIYTLKPNR